MKKFTLILSIFFIFLIPFGVLASEVSAEVKIGDYLVMGKYNGTPIIWRCVDIDDNGPLMMSNEIICNKAFDFPGNNREGSHARGYKVNGKKGEIRCSNGSNYWGDSNIRSWLNSNEEHVTWECGNPPAYKEGINSYSDEKGFLTNFSSDELNAIKLVNQKTTMDAYEYSDNNEKNPLAYSDDVFNINNYSSYYNEEYSYETMDKVFLLSIPQLANVCDNINILGKGFIDGLYDKGSNVFWLRTPSSHYSGSDSVIVYRKNYFGGYYSACADNVGVKPAFYLNENIKIESGYGTRLSPYSLIKSEYYDNEIKNFCFDANQIIEVSINGCGGNGQPNDLNVDYMKRHSSYSTKNEEEIKYFLYLLNCMELKYYENDYISSDVNYISIELKFLDGHKENVAFLQDYLISDNSRYVYEYNTMDEIIETAWNLKNRNISFDEIDYSCSYWAEKEIDEAIKENIILKSEQINFRQPISRNDVSVIVYRYLTKNGVKFEDYNTNPFSDTEAKAVLALYSIGLINGKSDIEFGTYDNITREEFAKIAVGVYENVNGEISVKNNKSFDDEEDISDWAELYINKVLSAEIMKGKDDRTFCPQDIVTKEEVIVSLIRIGLRNEDGSDKLEFRAEDNYGTENKMYYFYKNGKMIDDILTVYFDVKSYSDGLIAVTLSPPEADKKYWGYADESGRIVIPCFYTEAGDFHNGIATVKSDLFDASYEIDAKGNMVDKKEPVIKTDKNFDSPNKKLKYYSIDAANWWRIEGVEYNGKPVIKPSFSICGFVDGYSFADINFIYTDNNICGVINSEGRLILPFKYRPAYDFYIKDGMFPAYDYYNNTMELAYINLYGENAFGDKTFKSGRQFTEGYAAVKIKGCREMAPFGFRDDEDIWTYIDKNGNYATDERYDYAYPFKNGYAAVLKDGIYYKINKKFEIVETIEDIDYYRY